MSKLILLFIFVPFLALILLGLNIILAPNKPDSAKTAPYECGFTPIYGQSRSKMDIIFISVTYFFLILDIDLLITAPYALIADKTKGFGFSIFTLFFLLIIVGLIFEINSGILNLSASAQRNKRTQ